MDPITHTGSLAVFGPQLSPLMSKKTKRLNPAADSPAATPRRDERLNPRKGTLP